jgi:hypothetical protein
MDIYRSHYHVITVISQDVPEWLEENEKKFRMVCVLAEPEPRFLQIQVRYVTPD